MSAPAVYRSLAGARAMTPSAVTIGNFDGCHLGHQELLRRTVDFARSRGLTPAVVTFEPHPVQILRPESAPRLLSTLEQRIAWMGEAGIGQVLVIPFDLEFASWPPRRFAEEVLARSAKAGGVFVGDNFRFGAKAEGDITTLRSLGSELGFECYIVDGISSRGGVVSSTRVRSLIELGRVSLAGRLLGRPYSLAGPVIAGHGVGSRQTVPTLNIAAPPQVLPARGVYVTRTTDHATGRLYASATNIGFRPTFGGDPELGIETHIIRGIIEPRPESITVEFLYWLREERKFSDPAALKSQILRDAARAQAYVRRASLLY